MNSLSWMIYLAGVTGGISAVLIVAGILSAIAAIILSIVWLSTSETPSIYSWDDKDAKLGAHADFRAKVAGFIKPAAYCCAGALFTAAVIPSSGTIYAIAASEMGEEVLKSETGGKAVQALNAWLDRQIAGDKPAKED